METFNKQAVIETATRLEKLFLKYQETNADVAAAYIQCRPLIERAKSGQINKATKERLPSGYFSTKFDLFNIRDLYKTASELDMYLEGWESEEAFNKHMEKILKE
jgi:hypothetical protein